MERWILAPPEVTIEIPAERKSRYRSHARLLRAVAALALAYFVTGKLGLNLGCAHEHVTVVWPPSGIALAALLLWGYRLWPGILIGTLLVHMTTGDTITTGRTLAIIGIAVGNTLQGLLGAYFVNRFAGGRRAFDRAQDVFAFTALAALASTTIGATFGAVNLPLAGLAHWADFWTIWTTRWIGHAAGDLIFAPPLILWAIHRRFALEPRPGIRSRALRVGFVRTCPNRLDARVFTDSAAPGSGVSLHSSAALDSVPLRAA